MSKEKLRLSKLEYSIEDIKSCKKGVISERLNLKLRRRLSGSIMLSVILGFIFSYILFIIIKSKADFIEQANVQLYYIMIGLGVLLSTFFVGSVFSFVFKYGKLSLDKITFAEVKFSEIKYEISGGRVPTPYLKVKSFKFAPISPIKTLEEIFEQDNIYKFYYSSNTKILLAVEELT